MASLVSDTGNILTEMYNICEKENIKLALNKIHLSISKINCEHIACVEPKTMYNGRMVTYDYVPLKHNVNACQYDIIFNKIYWKIFSQSQKKYIITHEIAHIIDEIENGSDMYLTRKHTRTWLRIMSRLGYKQKQQGFIDRLSDIFDEKIMNKLKKYIIKRKKNDGESRKYFSKRKRKRQRSLFVYSLGWI